MCRVVGGARAVDGQGFFFKKAVPLPGVSLALVGCNTGSCTLVGLFMWAQWAGELYLILGR